eukprot:comp22981_c2_seq1/m.36564 comp22981_c2_seq1/g.36564  ORF comp22981_c2_seq1/g.36564 comp22981_c2_seq1/m.36564 type:complete len:355 (-) comp22981_c2_seq1:37-1101(-)
MGVEGLVCLVTGGSGFVGQRLVEMLLERGAKKVKSFDIAPKPDFASDDPRIEWIRGDLTKKEEVIAACEGVDAVWHNAAAVGPFLPHHLYEAVNYRGSLHVLEACRVHKIRKLIMSGTPSTRFDGKDMVGLKAEEMPVRQPGQFMQAYAETKAMGEAAILQACCDDLMTISVAPHQVYGPRDTLFFPSMLSAAKSGKLRIIGSGKNMISFTHVDNYCHGLIIAHDALYKGSPALGKFYLVTDDDRYNYWGSINELVVACGYPSITDKINVPTPLAYMIAYILLAVTAVTGIRFKLVPFVVAACSIHRWFNIEHAKRDLGYKPLFTFQEGWAQSIEWFKPREEWWQAKADAAERK